MSTDWKTRTASVTVPPTRMEMYRAPADPAGRKPTYAQHGFWTFAALLIVVVAMKAHEPEDLAGAVLITLASLVPLHFWIREGMKSLPILPAVGLMHIVYFALPLASQYPGLLVYEPDERLAAAVTVLIFLVSATAGAALVARVAPVGRAVEFDLRGVKRTVAVGLGVGLLFQYLLLGSYLYFLGEWYGVLRAFVWNLLCAVTFVVGILRGRGLLRRRGRAYVPLVVVNVLLSWLSLFLVQGIVLWSVFLVGYVLGARAVPWKFVAAMFLLALVLHAGKSDMRERYWLDGGRMEQMTLVQMPLRLAEWAGAGFARLSDDTNDSASILERASLLQMLLRAQHLSPHVVPFLEGETYASIPYMLVPRVLDPTKPATQAGMNLLNVHYGVLTSEDTQRTAVGWGLMSEAYANFGLPGVVACALLFGLFVGAVTRWARSDAPLSAPTMFGVIVAGASVSLEADAASYITSLFQAGIVVIVLSRFMRTAKGAGDCPDAPDARLPRA